MTVEELIQYKFKYVCLEHKTGGRIYKIEYLTTKMLKGFWYHHAENDTAVYKPL